MEEKRRHCCCRILLLPKRGPRRPATGRTQRSRFTIASAAFLLSKQFPQQFTPSDHQVLSAMTPCALLTPVLPNTSCLLLVSKTECVEICIVRSDFRWILHRQQKVLQMRKECTGPQRMPPEASQQIRSHQNPPGIELGLLVSPYHSSCLLPVHKSQAIHPTLRPVLGQLHIALYSSPTLIL